VGELCQFPNPFFSTLLSADGQSRHTPYFGVMPRKQRIGDPSQASKACFNFVGSSLVGLAKILEA
jgi:hypothetical protein